MTRAGHFGLDAMGLLGPLWVADLDQQRWPEFIDFYERQVAVLYGTDLLMIAPTSVQSLGDRQSHSTQEVCCMYK
jgi:hypothetical protein